MLIISKIKLHNFKRFKDLELEVNPDINILVGDNESGKSTILQAIDLVSRGSRTRIENIGLDKLFNVEVMTEFMEGDRNLNDLPEMYVELYFLNQSDPDLVGRNNSNNENCSGIYCCIDNTFWLIISDKTGKFKTFDGIFNERAFCYNAFRALCFFCI